MADADYDPLTLPAAYFEGLPSVPNNMPSLPRPVVSPNPGEPEHDTGSWTHVSCVACYQRNQPARGWAQTPVQVVADEVVPCCYCGEPTDAGIYVRDNPAEVHGA